jgi:hypothetical protein
VCTVVKSHCICATEFCGLMLCRRIVTVIYWQADKIINITFLTKCRVDKATATSVSNHGSATNGYIFRLFNEAVSKSDNATSNKHMLWNNNLDLTWKELCMA